MKRSRRTNRIETRNGLRKLFGMRRSQDAAPSAGALARAAGGMPEPAFEALENRQLLFTMTIDQVDPFTGLGTVAAEFGYTIPQLLSPNQPQAPQAPQPVTEDFNQDFPGAPGTPGALIASGTTFQSRFRVTHNVTTLRLDEVAEDNNHIFVGMAGGQAFTWQLMAQDDVTPLPVRNFAITFGPNGLDINNTTVELYLDGELLQTYSAVSNPSLVTLSNTGTPVGRFNFSVRGPGGQLDPDSAFDTIRFVMAPGAAATTFSMDDISAVPPQNRWVQVVEPRIFGARVVFTGPLGATAQFLDVHGRDMRATIRLGRPQGIELLLVDLNDDGIPNFNDGIGRINIAGTNELSAMTMVGGTIESNQTGFQFVISPDPVGLFDEMQQAGMGFALTPETPPRATGMPPGSGSVIVGSPWVRALDNYQPAGLPPGTAVPVTSGFLRTDQGVFVNGSISSVNFHAMMFGSSQFTGSADRISFGVNMGSLTVAGDLGAFINAADAGLWVTDNGNATVKTNSQLSVGRTVGQIAIGGRSFMNVTVTGDLNSPNTRPPRDIFRYFEAEWSPNIGTNPPASAMMNDMLNRNAYSAINKFFGGESFFARTSQASVFVDTFLQNDTVAAAEWIGSAATAVQINGELGGTDPVQTRSDAGDVYAFAADGSQDIVVQYSGPLTGLQEFLINARIVDQDGRTVASTEFASDDRRRAVGMRYRPHGPGVYYLVMNSTTGDAQNVVQRSSYVVTVSGMAPVSLGSYRTAAGSGSAFSNAINVLAGSLGSMRIGTGYVDGGGEEATPEGVFNRRANNTLDDEMALRESTTSIAGSLYNITTGGDIQSESPVGVVTINVGGNLGTINTGMAPAIGVAPTNGDLRNFNLTLGGAIGMVDIRGALGVDQDAPGVPKPVDGPGSVFIRTGTNPVLSGDVGMIRVGSFAGGGTLSLRTSNNSTLGGFLVQQDLADSGSIFNGIYGGIPGNTGQDIRLGLNSDLRFFDTPRIWQQNVPGVVTNLVPNEPVVLNDDGGGQVRIQVIADPTNTAAGGTIKAIPVSGSLGVAVGRIEVNLTGGARLQITSVGAPGTGQNDVISIGRIIITGADAGSSIGIDGPTQVDVWQIEQTGGDEFLEISNITPLGDIVSIDVGSLTTLEIRTGDLGQTQLRPWGPRRISRFLGIEQGGGGEVGDPIGVPANVMTGQWNGELYRPTNISIGVGGSSFLDDVGSPVDPYLDGLIVRNGDIPTVRVGGAVGDVIAASGNVISVTANFDRATPAGRFDGIVGTIYGNRISLVDIGDGLAKGESNALSSTGIFANDDILSVRGTLPGAFISSTINAANSVPGNTDPNNFPTDGIDSVDLRSGGDYVDAWIGSMNLDEFWTSIYPDDGFYAGRIERLIGTGADLLRSEVEAATMNQLRLNGGFFDASTVVIAGDANSIEAVGYRNSTITGGDLEFHANSVHIGGNLLLLTTFARAGDIEDLTVDVLGRIQEVSANHITRSSIDADIRIEQFTTVGDLRGSNVTTGLLTNAQIGRSIRSSEINVAGPIVRLTAADSITNTVIRSTGPDGRIDRITSRLILSGTIYSAGPIDTIEVTEGDMIVNLTTATNQRGVAGNIKLLKAARDLDLRTDISGTVDELVAGRHLGNQFNPGVILVRGDVKNISVPGGQLYSDVRIGQTLAKATIGTAFNLPGGSNLGRGSIIAYGRIEEVTINGDFGGQILSSSGGIGVVTINDGSLLASGSVVALDGTINNIVINRGHLLGNIHAGYHLLSVRLNGSDDGVFGDIGVNPALSSGTAYSQFRNQLPPGVIANASINGPSITAGFNIGRIIVTNGSIFETFIWAGRAIGTIDVNGDITQDSLTSGYATTIAAGSSIFLVHASGSMNNTTILAGIKSFGADNRPGGTGANADTVNSGRITSVIVDGSGSFINVAAGMDPGADGMYNTNDELVTLGISYVREMTIGGAVGSGNVRVYADSPTLTASPGVIRAGTNFATQDTSLHDGSAVGVLVTPDTPLTFTWGGVTGTILYTGSGAVRWDGATGRVLLFTTSLNTDLTITADGTLNNFRILSNDDASIGVIRVQTNLAGASEIVIDAYTMGIHTGSLSDTSTIRVGANVRAISTGAVNGGSIDAAFWARDIVVNGNFGTPSEFGEARIDIMAGGSITINGTNSGLVNAQRDLGSFTVNGAMNRAQFRTGASLGSFTSGPVSESRVSAANSIGPVTINGSVFDTAIQAGGDLGEDAAPGGAGFNADTASTGHIGDVKVSGDFARSSLIAGALRGPDGFFGTPDDEVGPGRSTIGSVSISGTQVGSNLNTEQYRIYSTGELGGVTIGGQAPANTGNFRVTTLATEPTPIRVLDLVMGQDSNNWTATFFFNQPINASTFGPALTISEVRSGGLTLVPLVEGVDYTIGGFNTSNNSIIIHFSRAVTDRNLIPQGGVPDPGMSAPGEPGPGLPGPGVFRFHLSADVLRAQVNDARLDGDANGFAASNEDFSQDEVAGDAGDKLIPEVINVGQLMAPQLLDMYGPADLDVVLDNNLTPDGLPDPNVVRTIRGVIGDHPDNDVNNFRVGGDTDIFKITLQAGQILRLGAMEGSARLVGRSLYNAAGDFQFGVTADTVTLPSPSLGDGEFTLAETYLIKTTGTYFIILSNAQNEEYFAPGQVINQAPGDGNTGDYRFTLEVFDDGDSGFASGNNSGNGTLLADAPNAIVFAGPNGVFQNPGDPTYDDVSVVTIGDFKFFLDAGPDGVRGTADDIVHGTNDKGITATRDGDTLTSTVNSAIGPRGHAGVPGQVVPDVDVYHINNGQAIAAGERITIKIKLAELGADLGSFNQLNFTDYRGSVQFGIFDTTGASAVDDALLVLSPTDFLPIAGQSGVVADRAGSSYGFDANGDFFITFITPGHIGGAGAASYAVYLQGVYHTDYVIEVTQTDNLTVPTVPQGSQNIFLETRGGVISWLQAGGLDTSLSPFAASVLGFTGMVGGMPVDQYVLTNVVSTLQSIVAATGLNVVFSTNPSQFEFQDFSTIFLTSTLDPISIINTDSYGYSQHSDPFNLDKNDEAVVFLPSMAQLGYTPSQADVDAFVFSLAAAIGRRAGELMGARITANSSFLDDPIDIMSANSVRNIPLLGNSYEYVDESRALSHGFDSITDTNFFLGRQNAFALLDKFLTP